MAIRGFLRGILPVHEEKSKQRDFFTFDNVQGPLFPFMLIVAFYALLIIAIFSWSGLIITILAILSVAVIASFTGTEINLHEHTYRDYTHILTSRWGTWKPISIPKYLLLSRQGYGHYGLISNHPYKTRVIYRVHLITEGERDLMLYMSYNEEIVVNIAQNLAQHFNWLVYDSTIDGTVLWFDPARDKRI